MKEPPVKARRIVLAAALCAAVAAAALAFLPTAFGGSGGDGNVGKIVFTSNRDAQNDIYVMNADGSRQTRLTTNLANDRLPRWSPSGGRIAFASNRDGNFEIYAMKADGTGQRRLTSDPLPDNYPSWTADGRQIVFQRGGFDSGEIYVMNANGTGPTNLTNDPAPDVTPATAPKGRKIVFGSTRGGSGGLFTMQANGSDLARLTTTSGTDWAPNWSPSGRDIVFLRDESGLDDDVYTVHADGSGLKRLTNTPTRDELNPAWSPDGSKILFAGCGVNGGCQLYTIRPEGSHEQQLTFGSFGPPPSAPYLESFNKNTINAAAWTVFGPASSNSAALVNQELEMTLGATATNDPALGAFGIQAAGRCLLEGDFDMQVDYRLLEWPFGNGAQAALAAEEPASFVGEVDRINSGGNDFYTAFSSAAFNATPTGDFSGTLRLVRSGGTSTAYFRSGANWVPVLTTAVPTDDTLITLTARSDDAAFGHQEVKIAFDNFRLNAGGFDLATCGDLRNSLPDWQARPLDN